MLTKKTMKPTCFKNQIELQDLNELNENIRLWKINNDTVFDHKLQRNITF